MLCSALRFFVVFKYITIFPAFSSQDLILCSGMYLYYPKSTLTYLVHDRACVVKVKNCNFLDQKSHKDKLKTPDLKLDPSFVPFIFMFIIEYLNHNKNVDNQNYSPNLNTKNIRHPCHGDMET